MNDHSKQQWTVNNNFRRGIGVRGFFLHFSSSFYGVWTSNQIICFCIIKIKFWISDIWQFQFACQFPLQNGKSILCSNLLEKVIHKLSLIWISAWKRLEVFSAGKAREFVQLTQTGEKTALFCLQNHDWKLDMALDSYFANPELYCREPKISVDRKKLDHVYSKYKGKNLWSTTKSRFIKVSKLSKFSWIKTR